MNASASRADCTAFLQWAMPRLELRWESFRRVRGQVCKRLRRRLATLGLPDLEAYRRRLGEHPRDDPAADAGEWALLDRLCFITLSRFCRDRDVWETLAREVIPGLVEAAMSCTPRARPASPARFRAWSAGCASGEEPFTLALYWDVRGLGRRAHGEVELELLATDADPAMLDRARQARFLAQSLGELPVDLRAAGFPGAALDRVHPPRGLLGDERVLDPRYARVPRFLAHDLRDERGAPLAAAPSTPPFDLVFCRNLAFSYFGEPLQRLTLERLRTVLRPGGCLVLGKDEQLPTGAPGFARSPHHAQLYLRLPVA